MELKRLFWDKNYCWYLNLHVDDTQQLSKITSKFNIEPLSKAETNDVDEYSDLCLSQKELRILLLEQEGRPAHKETLIGFIKHKVRGLHRKVAVAILVSKHITALLEKQLTVLSGFSPNDSFRLETLESLLKMLMDIF